MNNLKPGQPSSFAKEAVKRSNEKRWPRAPLSSDHDDGGVPLGLTNLKPKAAPSKGHEHNELNAKSKPFVPAGKNGKSESSDGAAFVSQDRISDRLMNIYHKQRRNTATATASQGYLSGALPAPVPAPVPLPTRGIDSIVQLGMNQHFPGLPSTQSYGVLPPVAETFRIPDPISSYAAEKGQSAYRSGLPNSVSDGNITGPRNIRGGYNAPETLLPKALPPLQLQPVNEEVKSQRSEMLNVLVGKTGPSLQDLLNPFFIPFMATYENAGPAEWGVIRLICRFLLAPREPRLWPWSAVTPRSSTTASSLYTSLWSAFRARRWTLLSSSTHFRTPSMS
ncbi:hypothetical protein F4775DRAFT_48164 [Biscogniauxia sp. FL1348]|nr:hypothetical protein F4775DRAFT_48164 [Biscogniauxia sp. FL1348]